MVLNSLQGKDLDKFLDIFHGLGLNKFLNSLEVKYFYNVVGFFMLRVWGKSGFALSS